MGTANHSISSGNPESFTIRYSITFTIDNGITKPLCNSIAKSFCF